MDNVIPQVDIVINGKVNPDLINIYNEWYDHFAISDGKMSAKDCAKFIKTVTGTREDITGDDHRIKALLDNYNKNGDGFLERNEFIQFYVDCTLKPEKKRVIWDNLKQMNVRNDLKKVKNYLI
jgi:hypothetical protein